MGSRCRLGDERGRSHPPSGVRCEPARRGAAFPGARIGRFLHAHHIKHWAHGGETKLENLVTLCSHHHRLVHEGGFGVERVDPRSVRFRRPDGRPIPPAAPGIRAGGRDLQHQHRAPPIDAYTCMPRSAGDSIDYGIAVEGLLAQALTPT
jgi:hypothetical protein